MELKQARDKLNKLIGKRELLLEQFTNVENQLLLYLKEQENCTKARIIVQKVAETTQQKLEYRISSLVSDALASVFDEPYVFSLKFVQRRNKTEADLVFSKGENVTDDLLNTAGGGAADIASFALRVACWSIKRNNPVLLIDEAFRFLSLDLQEKASEMIKRISKELGIQIILVSHLPGMIKAADKVFVVTNENCMSHVEEN